MTREQAEELSNVWISIELEESLGRDLWTQNLTLTMDAVTAALQETRDLLRETHDQTPQKLLAGCSLAELSRAEPSRAKPSRAEPS